MLGRNSIPIESEMRSEKRTAECGGHGPRTYQGCCGYDEVKEQKVASKLLVGILGLFMFEEICRNVTGAVLASIILWEGWHCSIELSIYAIGLMDLNPILIGISSLTSKLQT